MSTTYYTPTYATVTVAAADDVARFIERMIPTHCPKQDIAGWQAVADALFAISNDTDCIVTDPEIFDD